MEKATIMSYWVEEGDILPFFRKSWAQGVEQKYEYTKERISYILAKHEQLVQIQTSPLCTTVYFS